MAFAVTGSADDPRELAEGHPLAAVAALAAARGGPALTLRVGYGGKLVRLSCETPPLWILMADEDGSRWDKWTADDPRIRFVKLPRALAARGPDAMLDHIERAATAADDGETP